MKISVLPLALAILMSRPCANALDLTPRFSDTTVGEITQRRMFFADGDRKITVHLDFQTRVEAGAGGAVFRFLKIPTAIFILRRSPMSSDEAFQGVSMQRYREAAHRLLPPNVTSIESLEEVPDPITLNGWHSYRFAFSYADQGALRISSVTFINLSPEEQIVMLVAAPSLDFDDALQRSWQILRTWQVMPEGPTAVPAQAPETSNR